MGLIKAGKSAIGSVLEDQWKEYFYCDALPVEVLARRGRRKESGRSFNTKSDENIISNGSAIAVADGQCMLIVDQGKVVEVCAEPGEYTYDSSTEPSVFSGSLGESILAVFRNIGKRFTYGGEIPRDQRVYYFNTKELMGNKYGTPSPVPFRVLDEHAGIDMDISVKCFGEYSYKLVNPLLFYSNVCGNITEDYTRDMLEGQMKSELLTALQPAFARISALGVRYSAVPGHTMELAAALKDFLSAQWRDFRGIEIQRIGVSSIKASEEDEQMMKELQRTAALADPARAAGYLASAQGAAMQAAAANQATGPALAFMGMNMAQQAGGANVSGLFQQAQQLRQQSQASASAGGWQGQTAAAGAAAGSWSCSCGQTGNTGKFCQNCGQPRPAGGSWTCSCGTANQGKFCTECGRPRP